VLKLVFGLSLLSQPRTKPKSEITQSYLRLNHAPYVAVYCGVLRHVASGAVRCRAAYVASQRIRCERTFRDDTF